MRLVLVRHGETEHNRLGLTLGRSDEPLTGRGRAQAAALAASFAAPPAAILASPLERAAETARLIGERTGVEVRVEPDLIEMDVGEMEHLTSAELRQRYPEFLRRWLSADAADARMPGGETLREVQERAWRVVERARRACPDGEVVAVTHNFVILTVACRAIGLPLGAFRRLRHGLAGRSVLDIREDGAALLHWNDQSHILAAGLGEGAGEGEARR